MKLPRGIAADDLIRHEGLLVHVITIPRHNPLKAGTLHAILAEVAEQRSVPIQDLVQML